MLGLKRHTIKGIEVLSLLTNVIVFESYSDFKLIYGSHQYFYLTRKSKEINRNMKGDMNEKFWHCFFLKVFLVTLLQIYASKSNSS